RTGHPAITECPVTVPDAPTPLPRARKSYPFPRHRLPPLVRDDVRRIPCPPTPHPSATPSWAKQGIAAASRPAGPAGGPNAKRSSLTHPRLEAFRAVTIHELDRCTGGLEHALPSRWARTQPRVQ